jgi:glycosyltransferase involved in cell wall biosynthesis
LPHIALLRESGIESYVLQLGLDGEPIPPGTDPWQQPIRLLNQHHLYVPVPSPTQRYQRTRFFYGAFLRKYVEQLRILYGMAVDKWGQPDILHAHVSLPGGYAAACLGEAFSIPVIVQEHYSGFESDTRFPWRTGHFVREMADRINGFYAVSLGYARRIEKTGVITVTGVLPNPIDTDLFISRPRLALNKQFQIVTAGMLSLLKGADLLFEALRQLTSELDWHLTWFGDLSQRDAFGRWLNDPRFASRLTLPGQIPQAEMVKIYSQSDLYVVSSRRETANVSMLQAMACGIPVVTTSCGAPETLINDTVGIAVKPNDPQALAEGILKVARNPQQFDSDALRRFVVYHYSKTAVGSRVMDAYEMALNRREIV